MKKIEIFVRPENVRDVCEALHDMGLYGIALSESRFIDNAIEDDFRKLDSETFIPATINLAITVPGSLVEPVIATVRSVVRKYPGGGQNQRVIYRESYPTG